MSKKIMCAECKNKMAVWIYMPGYGTGDYLDDFSCDDCVSRGCSCNNESLSNSQDDIEELETQLDEIKERAIKYNYKVLNYGKKIHNIGKEIEVIIDKEVINNLIHKSNIKDLMNYSFIPLDENMREFPCCEYEYDENGFDYEK